MISLNFSNKYWNILCNFFLGMDASLICFALSMFEIWLIFTSGKIITWENRKQVAKTVINLKKIYL